MLMSYILNRIYRTMRTVSITNKSIPVTEMSVESPFSRGKMFFV